MVVAQRIVDGGALGEVARRGARAQCVGQAVDLAVERLVDGAFAQRRDDDEMPTLQQAHRGQQVLAVLVAQVGDQHQQATTTLPQRQFGSSGEVIGGDRPGLQVVAGAQQRVDGAEAALRRDPALLAAGREQADRVALPQREVGHHQRRIQRVVEVCEVAPRLRGGRLPRQHAAAGVEHHDQLLVLLVLVLARDQLARTRGRLPVDLAQAVANAILAHLVEVGAFAAAALDVRADHARSLFRGQQREPRQRCEIGEHPYPLRHAGDPRLPPQAQRRRQAQLHAVETEITARVRTQAVTETRNSLRWQHKPPWQSLRFPAARMQIEHVDALAPRSGLQV